MPINTVFELGGDGRRRGSGARGRRDAPPDPRPPPVLALRQARRGAHERDDDAVLRPASGGWATDLLARLDVPTRSLPEIVPPGTVLGRSSPEVADATGSELHGSSRARPTTRRRRSRPSPSGEPSSAFLSVGTWSLVGVETSEPRDRRAAFAANLTNEGGVDGNVPRAAERHRALAPARVPPRVGRRGPRLLVRRAGRARAVRAGPTVVRRAERPSRSPSPGDMPRKSPRLVPRTGQPEPAGPGEIVRCVLESLALKHAETVELARLRHRGEPAELHVVGGGARNELLCRWTAEAAGVPVLAGPEEATVIGNLLVQAIALGELGSLADAREVVRRSFAQRPTSRGGQPSGRRRVSASPASARRARGSRSAREQAMRVAATGSRARGPVGRPLPASSASSTASSTARTCSAPTGRSRTRAAATRRRRGRWSTTPAARCACSG